VAQKSETVVCGKDAIETIDGLCCLLLLEVQSGGVMEIL